MTTSSASPRRTRVAVILGGVSGEHNVSCLSGASVLAHLSPEDFDVRAIGITQDGSWRQVDPAQLTAAAKAELPSVNGGELVAVTPDATSLGALAEVDVVFPVLHGPMGEDGTLQGLLELAGIPYVGPGVLASAAAMDKEFTKKLLAAEGLPVGTFVVLRPGRATVTDEEKARLGLPVFVKPARAGSSLGVSRVTDWTELPAAIEFARRADPKVLVESAVVGREVECGVLEHPDGRLQASPIAEIHVAGEHTFYDFDAKYLDSSSTFDLPAEISPEVAEQIQQMAIRAFRALDAQGLSRVDFFISDTGEVSINEVNTMPGFTSISMYPKMFDAAGVSYPELLATLIRTAIARGTGLR